MINSFFQKINQINPFNKKVIINEFATRKASNDFSAFAGYLPDPDPVLKQMGIANDVYDSMLSDPHVLACVQSRKAGVTSLEWGIDRGKAKSKEAEIIEQLFYNLDLQNIFSEILNAPLYGYQPLEVMWTSDGSLILPTGIVAKPPEWFLFDADNILKFKTKDNPSGIELPAKKFLCPKYYASYQNPYGRKLLSAIFWAVTFKRGGMKFWAKFIEKYGMPYLFGKVARGAAQTEIDDLAEMLENMVQDAIAVIPDDSSVELKEAASKSSADIYKSLIDTMNSEISKAILGQTLTTDIGNTGSYAASQTHFQVRADLVDSDRVMVEKALNQLINWIYAINWSNSQSERPVFSMWEEEDVDLDLANRDKILTESGVTFTKKYFQKNYGLEEEDFELSTTPINNQPLQFSSQTGADETPVIASKAKQSTQEAQDEIDKLMQSFSDSELQNQMQEILQPALDLIQKSKNPQEALNFIAESYPQMDTKKLENTLTKLIFISEIFGNIQNGNTPNAK